VVVLERNETFGGALGTFKRGGLTIEGSLHEIDGFDDGDPKAPIVEALGIREAVELVDVVDLYEVRSPLLGDPFVLPAHLDTAQAAANARFPMHGKGLESYFRRISAVRTAMGIAMHKQDDKLWWVVNGPRLPRRFWPLLRAFPRSLGEVMTQDFGSDEAVKMALAGNLQYYADDMERMWFTHYAAAQGSFHLGGGYYVRGGSGRLVDHLVSLIRGAGGEAHSGRRVTRILLDDGRAAGVEHEARDGGEASRETAPVIFGNAAPHALADLLPAERRTEFMAPFADKPLSISLWTLGLGFDRRPSEFGVNRYSTWIFPDWMRSLDDLKQSGPLFGAAPDGRDPALVFADYSSFDSGLPGPPYFGSVGCLDLIENWEGIGPDEEHERRERWSDRIVQILDREFPGLGGAVVQRELFTARNNRDYLNTPRGVVYGFAPRPPRWYFFKPGTAIKGLWIASSYGGFGGYTGAILSGGAAARAARKAS
jgi:phytoene dehydrogenase-like protein